MNTRRLLAYAVLGAVIIGIVAWLANYLSTGTIQINSANKNDTITLQKTSGGPPLTRIATGSLQATIKHGRYTATVRNGLKTTIQIITFDSGHRSFHYSISLSDLQAVETVSYQSAQNVAASSSNMVYLGSNPNILYRIDNRNSLQNINSTQEFKFVAWANPSFGAGQGSDGQLYTISGNSVRPLKVPFPYGGKAVNVAVSPDKKIYVSYGSAVYVGGQSGNFKKIYTASSEVPALSAGVSGVAVSDSKYGARASGVSKPLLAIINTTGKVTKKNIEAERVEWSPDGRHVAVVNQASPVVYDAVLRQITVIPTMAAVGQFGWTNNGILSYTSSYQFWTYDMTRQMTRLLADVPTTDSINGLSVSSDGSYIYINTLNPFTFNYAIKRIGLKNQQIPAYVDKLQKILPQNLSNYSINMVNFSGTPVILVQPGVGTPSGNSTQAAQSQLQAQGIDTAQLRFEQGPSVIVDD